MASKSTEREIQTARTFVKLGNPEAAARTLASIHRSGNRNDQAAASEALFELNISAYVHYSNGCMIPSLGK